MMSAAGATTAGQRPYNEDAYLVRDLTHVSHLLGGIRVFMLVSDGMGGHQAGDVASRIAVDVANRYVDHLVALAAQGPVALDPAQALREIAADAHDSIVREAAARGAPSMGATCVAVFASDDQGWVAHVGDSRAYIIGEATPRRLTTDHSQVARMVAEGVLTEREAQNHPQRNIIERALGFDAHEPDLSAFRLERWDGIVLCTDGFADVVDPQTAAAVAQSAASAPDAAELLVQLAQRAGVDDNATLALWAGDWELLRQAPLIARRRPATIQIPEAAAAAAAVRRRAPAAQRARKQQRLQVWVRIGLVALLVVVAMGVVWLFLDAWNTGGTVSPTPTKTKQPAAVVSSSTASGSESPVSGDTATPPPEPVFGPHLYGEEGSELLSGAPVRATLNPTANIRMNSTLATDYLLVTTLTGEEPHTVWCWRFSRPLAELAFFTPPGGRGSRLWYLVGFFDSAGVAQSGWVHESVFAGKAPPAVPQSSPSPEPQ